MRDGALRVAVDAHNLLVEVRGIARYLEALLVRFAARDDVELTLLSPALFPQARLRERLGTARFRTGRRVPRTCDVVWHPWNGTFFRSDRPAVVTLHDAAPFRFPSDDAKRRRSEQEPFLRSARSARAVLTNSVFTASEVQTFLGVPPERITVTPLAVDRAVFRPDGDAVRSDEGRPYALLVGAGEARKNAALLAVAHARAFPDASVALVVAGGAAAPDITARRLPIVGSGQLAAWYRGARWVAVPALYEGFGLPLLEAMACGVPVAASRAAALPEVGADACAWIDEPTDVEAWVPALRALAADDDLRATLRTRGLERARAFSWDRCAEQTLGVLRGAAQV